MLSRIAALCALVATVSLQSVALHAQPALQPTRTSAGWTYQIATRIPTPRGALVLMPGFGGSFADFSESGNSTAHRSVLADSLASRGIALVFVAPPPGVLFGGASHMSQLEATITEALKTFSTAALPLAIGGFSAGGTDAVLFAERCAAGGCAMPHPVRAVFAVDAPLDWYRLWDKATMVLDDRPPGANVDEARSILAALLPWLGKAPTPKSPRYLSASPLAPRARDAVTHGNSRRWRFAPIRSRTFSGGWKIAAPTTTA